MAGFHKNARAQRLNNRATYWLTRLVAPITLILGLSMIYERGVALFTFERTEGVIIGARYDDSSYSRLDATRVSSHVRFTDMQGQEHVFFSVYSTAKSDDIGQTVPVLYNPDFPGEAVIPDFWDFYVQPIIISLMSILLWWFGTLARTFVPPTLKPEDVLGPDGAFGDDNKR